MSNKLVWDFWAKYYDKLWVQKYSLKPTRNKIRKILSKEIDSKNNLSLLDVGCGIGELLNEIYIDFYDKFDFLYGVDYSSNMIKKAQDSNSFIKYDCIDSNNLLSNYNNLDFIVCTHSFPYYKNQTKTLLDFHCLLTTNGDLLLAQASANSLYDKFVLFFVKLTTGKAHYPSINEIKNMTNGLFTLKDAYIIKERFFMPSIVVFHLKK